MLTRRGFTGFASCAICAVTGFIASEASAQGAPPAVPGVKRTILSQMDGPVAGYVTINMEVEIDPGVTVARHTHPGIESSYVLEGGFELPIQGQPTRMLKVEDRDHLCCGEGQTALVSGLIRSRIPTPSPRQAREAGLRSVCHFASRPP